MTAQSEISSVKSKIRDQRLVRFAEGDSNRCRTVLLKVDLPQARLKIGRKRKIGREVLPRRKLEISKPKEAERSAKLSEMARQLENEGIKNKALSSGTIIATVSPDQLRKIVTSKLIKSIVPNRKHTY